ncbi:hypothetical protein GN316_10285 [Xylophilus sp. Kf1]|nr:hypothetical protein [Xylophilus sp. Kf1]
MPMQLLATKVANRAWLDHSVFEYPIEENFVGDPVRHLILTAVKCVTALVLTPLALLSSVMYLSDAARRHGEHRWEVRHSPDADAKYFAKVAYIGGDDVLLRVYRKSDGKFVAERAFEYPEEIRLYWSEDSLVYTTESSYFRDGFVGLPPTWLERAFTYIP